MTVNYDEQISAKENEKVKLIEKMELIKDEYLKEIEKFSRDWIQTTTKREVTGNPDLALDIGKEKLGELKRKVESLIEKLPTLVNQYLNKNELWWHKKEDKAWYSQLENRILSKIEREVQFMYGELGIILSEYGFVRVEPKGFKDYGIWAEKNGYGMYGKPKYPYRITFSESVLKIDGIYIEEIKRGQKLNEEIDRLKSDKSQANAGDLWDSL